jgi:mannose/fructose/N-acetylgalactosamine-specific phosphotransferase system component IID
MQNIGFTNAILPGLKNTDPEKLSKVAEHYLTFFNTQPYMAPTILGVTLNLIEQGQEETAIKINPSLSGSLAALGDTFFWATLKPLMSLLFLIMVICDRLWGLFLVLVLYNSMHIWTMVWGFFQGYRNGPDGALSLGRTLSVDLSKNIALLIPFLSGMLLCLIINWKGIGQGYLAGFALFAAVIPATKLRLNPIWIVYGVFILSMIWAMVR